MSRARARSHLYAIEEAIRSYESGGKTVAVEEFLPRQGDALPGVLILHGADGLLYRGPAYRDLARELARQGYAAFLPHYFEPTRVHYADLGAIQNHFLSWLAAIADAITHAGSHARVDAECIALIGFSLGGYLSLALATQEPRIKAVVEFFGGLPDFFADRIKAMPPVLILHGDADYLVPVSEARRLERLLSRENRPHEIQIYSGIGHGFHGKEAADALQRTLAFLDRHLREERAA